jgi:hypothetical protein
MGTVSSVSSDSIVKGIIDDIIKTAVKTAEVDEQKTKRKHENSYLLRKPLLIRSIAFICNIDRDWMIYRKHPIRSLLTSML